MFSYNKLELFVGAHHLRGGQMRRVYNYVRSQPAPLPNAIRCVAKGGGSGGGRHPGPLFVFPFKNKTINLRENGPQRNI